MVRGEDGVLSEPKMFTFESAARSASQSTGDKLKEEKKQQEIKEAITKDKFQHHVIEQRMDTSTRTQTTEAGKNVQTKEVK